MKSRREFFQLMVSIAAGGTLFSCFPVHRKESVNQVKPTFTDVYRAGMDGYHTYRIPALLLTGSGVLLAFCEGRKNDR
ncbi:MAG TPA: sialidase family protein, partial [bacterium]|nr:sialidase family protein [bacterium]